MIKDFFILDFSYDVIDNIPVIFIWAIDSEGNRVVLLEKNFRPYFYAVVEEDKINQVIEEIKKISKTNSPITDIRLVNGKKLFGQPISVLKLETVIPAYVRIYRDDVAKVKGVRQVLEADIRFYMRYSIDLDIRPFYWISADVQETQNGNFRANKVYEIKEIKEKYNGPIPRLRKLSFSIEVYSKHGSPNPRKDPVIVISVRTDNTTKTFVSTDLDDKQIIKDFVSFIQDYDPDIIYGFNSNSFDWQYLLERSHSKGIKLDIGRRINGEPSQGVYGHFSVTGRLNVDLAGFVNTISEVKLKTLVNVCDYLGIVRKEDRVNLDWYDIPKFWEDKSKKDLVIRYVEDNAKSVYLLGESFLPFTIELTKITGLPLDQLSMASVGYRVEWLLMRESNRYNELIPNKEERTVESYEGGLVIPPVQGLHENVIVLDFSSMYPSIMIKYNVGPDTLVKGECDNCWVSPIGHRFRKEPPGLYKFVLENLVKERKEIKSRIQEIKDEYEIRLLNERQKALKVMANAFYGYMGWANARWYSREGAEAVTSWGRNIITEASKIAIENGFKVVYGDTDSIFIKGNGDLNKLQDIISQKFGIEIKIDKVYRRIFFTESKKRYAGITEDGKIDIVGFEAIRGDWCELAREVQKNVIEIILRTGKVDEAVRYVRKVVLSLRRGEFKVEDLIIWKGLDKDVNEYTITAPHVIAAKKALKAGYLVTRGSKIGYVIVKGSNKLSERAEPYFLVRDNSRIDISYYVENQIIPSAMHVLKVFGVKEDSLRSGGTDILSFFKK
ncbi:DNA-directed DNA polymerase [Stygiolobus caldivivus]|uniref:DNA polymerase n=1 Tax=Stygiolobus caldivivus TaxID=2824673 RepID=A0A8D5U5C6_9CREN|nr:DNA polymerase II [Stygiolobus caldivivus]BCU69204.1 DNA polymerase [Stygiolobus caldivivus]